MAKTVYLPRLGNAECIQLVKDVISFTDSGTTPLPPPLDSAKSALASTFSDLELLYKQAQATDASRRLARLDARRDTLLRSLYRICNGFSNDGRPEQAAAGQAVCTLFDVYGGGGAIAAQNYNAQSTSVRNLLRDMAANPVATSALRLLGLDTWVDELKLVNTEFETGYTARVAEEVATDLPFTMAQKRSIAKEQYEALVVLVESFYNINAGAEPWVSMLGRINALTEKYDAALAARTGKPAEAEAPASAS